MAQGGFEEGGTAKGCAKKCPVDTFLARGKILSYLDAPREGVWTDSLIKKRQTTRQGGLFYGARGI